MMKVIEILSSQKDHSPRNTNSKFAPEKMLGLEDELRFLFGGRLASRPMSRCKLAVSFMEGRRLKLVNPSFYYRLVVVSISFVFSPDPF